MKNVILVHGWVTEAEYRDERYPTASNSHWLPWLTKQLMIRDIHTVALEMPNGYYPQYDVWKRELERFEITSDTVLVGHSCGAGFLVRWLSEGNVKVNKVFLIAPWLGDNPGRPFDEPFFNFTMDENLTSKTAGVKVMYSTDDSEEITAAVEKLRSINDLELVEFRNKGHFTLKDMGTDQFPELLEQIIG